MTDQIIMPTTSFSCDREKGIITGANSQHWLCLAALAIGAHRNKVGFAVADHGLEKWQRDELERIGVKWIDHRYPDLSLDNKMKGENSLTIKTWLKPWICKSSPFEKTIWIDSDAIITGDITPIFDYNLAVGKKVLWERKRGLGQPIKMANILFGDKCNKFLPLIKYINAGVFSFSKNNDFIDEWIETSKILLNNQEYIELCFAKDQDALILTTIKRMISGDKEIPVILDDCYNYPADGCRNGKYNNRKQVSSNPSVFLEESIKRHTGQKIIHWVGFPKPWHLQQNKSKFSVDEPIDIIIPLGNGSAYNNIEIKMALRSIEKYVTGYRKIIIIGPNIPKFLVKSDKLELVQKKEDKVNKQARVQKKIEWAIKNLDITDSFAYWNDDFLVLKPFDIRKMPDYVGGNLPLSGGKAGWTKQKYRTRIELTKENYPVLNYELHVPMIFEKKKHLLLSKYWNKSQSESILMRSLYGNTFNSDNKKEEWRDVKLQDKWGQQIWNIVKTDRWVISYGDGALNKGFDKWMEENYPIDIIQEKVVDCCNNKDDKYISEADKIWKMVHREKIMNKNREFTYDWFDRSIHYWEKLLGPYKDRNDVHFLEVGCFEGRGSCWLCDNILTGKNSDLTCVDHFSTYRNQLYEKKFDQNIIGLPITKLKGNSTQKLAELISSNKKFDFIYIDGEHTTKQVLMDLCFSWNLILPNGVILCDDYNFPKVKSAIKFHFLKVYEDQVLTTHVTDPYSDGTKQIAIWKK